MHMYYVCEGIPVADTASEDKIRKNDLSQLFMEFARHRHFSGVK